jgi:hypothetical protein
MLGFLLLVSEPEPTSFDNNKNAYHHPHHKNQGMTIMLSDLCRRDVKDINCGPMPTTGIDCG